MEATKLNRSGLFGLVFGGLARGTVGLAAEQKAFLSQCGIAIDTPARWSGSEDGCHADEFDPSDCEPSKSEEPGALRAMRKVWVASLTPQEVGS